MSDQPTSPKVPEPEVKLPLENPEVNPPIVAEPSDQKSPKNSLKIVGLKQETEKMHEESKGSPKLAHESSIKAPTRNMKCELGIG